MAKAVRKITFKRLVELKNSHINYVKYEMQNYLKGDLFSNFEAKFIFQQDASSDAKF